MGNQRRGQGDDDYGAGEAAAGVRGMAGGSGWLTGAQGVKAGTGAGRATVGGAAAGAGERTGAAGVCMDEEASGELCATTARSDDCSALPVACCS